MNERRERPYRAIFEIFNKTRVGEIDGVSFDVRHPDLPVETWHAPDAWYLNGLSFPWDRDSKLAPDDPPSGKDDPHRASECIVRPGDAISISRLENFHRGQGQLADRYDNEECYAYFEVKHRDGGRTQIGDPIRFVPMEAMGPHSPYLDEDSEDYAAWVDNHRITFEKIARRIKRLADPGARRETRYYVMRGEKIFEATKEEVENASEGTKVFTSEVRPDQWQGPRGEWIRFADTMRWMAEDELADLSKGRELDLSMLIDLAASAGYALATAESESRIVPLAKGGLKARASLAKATSAARSRANPVREAASADIAANPKTSQGACVRRVAARLGRGDREVARLIGSMFEWRDLPGGGREKRPKQETLTSPDGGDISSVGPGSTAA
jgi:hypothetical protein